ncbi:alpha/beta hydrolase [Gordonia desulfuricans]|uniref:Alpha/beta hydrolase n=2 Tax=Gordoniaceae TaxID=85026 RepID=A0A7K3LIX6_9ACTN|nr:alpha/beta hydrolase [Gordonia desulfuricans]
MSAMLGALVVVAGCASAPPVQPDIRPSVDPPRAAHTEVVPIRPVHTRSADTATGVTVEHLRYPVPGGHPDPHQNWMDLYLPDLTPPPGPSTRPVRFPLVILLHGGGWQSRIGASTFSGFSRILAERGLAVLNVEYRRVGKGGGWPTTFTDVGAAMDHVPAVAARYRQVDASHAVVVGHSAGAQLAVWAATRAHLAPGEVGSGPRFRPSRVFSLAGPLDLRRAVALGDHAVIRVLGGTPGQVPSRYASVDPIENIDPTIPIVVVTGTRDQVVRPELAERYVAADQAVGGHARLVLLAGQTHSSIVDPRSSTFGVLVDEIVQAAGTPAG